MVQKSFFLSLMMMGLLMVASSHMWMFTWIGLEMISFFLIPFMYSDMSYFINKLLLWKYFFIQFISSSMLLLSFMMSSSSISILSNYSMNYISSFLILIAMYIKLGIFPFHSWMFDISENLPWMKFLMFTTIPKFGPLIIMWNLNNIMSWEIIMISSVVVWFCLGCSYEYSIRRFLVYSSMMNMTWMTYSCTSNIFTLYMYMMSYSIIMICIMMLLSKMNNLDFSTVGTHNFESNLSLRLMNIFNVMSLCGFPPLLGFLVKLEIVTNFIQIENLMMCIPLMICSIYMVTVYINISFMSMFNKKSLFHNTLKSSNYNIMIFMFTMVQVLPVTIYLF